MHPEMKSRSKKKNCYSLTIKLPFFYETRVLFVLRKNMSACDFQGSKKRTGNYVRAAAEEASPSAAAAVDRPKRKPKRARPCRDRDHRICKYAAHIVGMSGHIFLLLFIFFFCCFFLPHYFNFPSPSLTSHRALSSHEQLNYFCT